MIDEDARRLHTRRLEFISRLLYETPGGMRFTQDSPILTNVWINYALEPRKPQKLILTVDQRKGAGQAALELRDMLDNFRRRMDPDRFGSGGIKSRYEMKVPIGDAPGESGERERAKVSYISGQISAELYFDEMMRLVLPLTPWWKKTYDKLLTLTPPKPPKKKGKASANHWLRFPMASLPPDEDVPDWTESSTRERDLIDGLILMRTEIDAEGGSELSDLNKHLGVAPDPDDKNGWERLRYVRRLPSDLLWLVRIAGLIGRAFHGGYGLLDSEHDRAGLELEREFAARLHPMRHPPEDPEGSDRSVTARANWIRRTRMDLVNGFCAIYNNWSDDKKPQHPEPFVWRVTRNRPIRLAVNSSSLTVKADAARRLFDISCKKITWAVVDSGIDRKHPSFHEHAATEEKRRQEVRDARRSKKKLEDLEPVSRVTKTLDFTTIRELLDYELISTSAPEGSSEEKLYSDLVTKISKTLPPATTRREKRRKPEERAEAMIDRLCERMRRGQDIDWEDFEPLITVTNPDVPINDHGTHVGGILGADWIDEDEVNARMEAIEEDPDVILPSLSTIPRRMQGVCPDIKLIDVRVFRTDGATDEFELLAAVQFLRWLNARAGYMVVHGANLSLSLIHEVRRFACGRTPICDECNESAALGMVMVAAAGNRGYESDDPDMITQADGYRDTSITDPGNAEHVITVGSTHRKRPHDYGISFFSSRGPTGDGRLKPDLVAPGEKIDAPTPNEGSEGKDGTSMAAPHVSGAAAMLMARNSELIGNPQRIKRILCESATDLGRERYFQGHGLVDILRALQSV